jgi:hypothetical protein
MMVDCCVTLVGQAKEYWAGNYAQAKEGDPICRYLLGHHPLAFVAGNLVIALVLIGLLLLTPRIVAAVFSVTASLGRWGAVSSWFIMDGYRWGQELSWGLGLLTIICLAIGVPLGWRAKSDKDYLRESRTSFGVRWAAVAGLFALLLAIQFVNTRIPWAGKVVPLASLVYCFVVFIREMRRRKRSQDLPAPNPAHALDGGIPLQSSAERSCPAASDVQRYP